MCHIFSFLLLFPILLSGQNLIVNPSFENHLKPLERLQQATFLKNAEFGQTVQGWESFSSANMSALFSTIYKATQWQAESLGYNFKKCQPYKGHSMIRLWVNPKGGECGTGSGGYIQSRLSDTLMRSFIYSVSFWVFIPKSDGTFYYPLFPQNFGMAFSDKNFKGKPNCMQIDDTPFVIESVKTEEWYNIEFFIKPTKPLINIALGVFFNPTKPYIFSGDDSGLSYYFFIDNIDIHKVEDIDSIITKKTIAYPFLNSAQQELEINTDNEPIKVTCVYFDKDIDTLNALGRITLDSIIIRMRNRKEALFAINGHTDIIGQGNKRLSERRSFEVRDYLIRNGQFSIDRFELNAFGSDSIVADNRTEMGRRLNRRVEIKELNYTISYKYYRMASKYCQEVKGDSAFYYLFEWLKLDSSDGILLLHDPDLVPLRNSIFWKKIEAGVKAKYKKYKQPDLSYKLDNLYFKDQRYRSIGSIYKEAKGYIPIGIDTIRSTSDPIVLFLDSINSLEAIQFILEKSSWPEPSLVGKRQSDAIFYAIQHSRDLQKMKKCLPILELACQNNYMPWSRYAMMFDRSYLLETGYQRYGTQFQADTVDSSLYKLAPIENPIEVDKLRSKINLPPLDLSSYYIVRGN